MDNLSLAKYGALHGVSKQAAAKWKARGLLVFIDGKVDVTASDENLKLLRKGGAPGAAAVDENDNRLTDEKRLSVRRGESAASAAERILKAADMPVTLDEARLMKEKYLALLNQLEYDQKSGLVVMASEVVQAVGEEYSKVRTRLLAIPSEQAPRLTRIKTATEMQHALEQVITEALEALTIDSAQI